MKHTPALFTLIAALMGSAVQAGAPDISINEVMAKNGTTRATASGVQGIDWLELYNAGTTDVDLAGWYIGNDPTKGAEKWRVVAGSCVVPAHGYKIVWCDGDGRCTDWAADEAHVACNISTEAGKHTMFLASEASVEAIVDQVLMPAGMEDVSYGRDPSSGAFFYYPTPTPGAANTTAARHGVTPTVSFSERHGYKDAPFELTLSCPDAPTAAIYYTLDGSSPVPNATGTYLYASPITVSRTTVIRAAACDADSILQMDASATYLFLSDILTQDATPPAGFPASKAIKDQVMLYGMRTAITQGDAATRARLCNGFTNGIRTVSFVIDPAHLFSKTTGIYVNAQSSGRDWERPMMLEQIHPTDEKDEFSVPCGVRIRGAFSRRPAYPKHGFHVLFRGEYGMGTLKHPLFGDEGASSYDRIDFRTEQNCSWANGLSDNSLTHEVFSRDSQRDLGQTYARSRYYHLFLNGIYWGVYQSEERASASYAQSYVGGSEENYDIVRTYNDYGTYYHTGVVEGDTAAWSNLWHITMNEGYGPNHAANYNRVRGLNPDGTRNPDYPIYVNVTNLVCYLLTSQFTADGDTPATIGGANNIIAFRNRVEGDGATEGFLWNRHDSEHSLGHGAQGGAYNCGSAMLTYGAKKYSGLNLLDKFNPSGLHYELCTNAVYRRTFADLVQKHVLNPGGAMTAKACEARYRTRMAEVHDAVMGELARWGGTNNVAQWNASCNKSIQFIRNRGPFLIANYRELGWFPSIDAATVLDQSGLELATGATAAQGAHVYLQSGANGTVYYTTDGSDPCLEDGSPNPQAQTYAGDQPEPVYTQVIRSGDVWKYSETGAKPAEDWAEPAYDDSGWKSGPSDFGFASKRTFATTLKRYVNGVSGTQVATYYFRTTFTLPEGADKMTALRAHLDCNDGYIVYLNGVEVKRDQVGSSDYTGYSPMYGMGVRDLNWTFDAGLLHAGVNTIAVEVHQYAHAGVTVNSADAWWNLDLSYVAPGPAAGGIAVPAAGLRLATRVLSAAGEWSALNAVDIAGDVAGDTSSFTGDYDEPVTLTASGKYVFENANLKAGLVVADGLTVKLNAASNSVNAIASLAAPGAEVRFTGDGTMRLQGADTLAVVSNLVVKSGTLQVKSTGVAATKTPVVNVLGFVEQTGGLIDLDLDVATTNQIYGIYVANKDLKDAADQNLGVVYATFDGGALQATVGATKSSAVCVSKGSVKTTFKGGLTVDAVLKGVEPRVVSAAGDISFKNCQAQVSMPSACSTITGARVFKSDKKISFSDIDGHYVVDVRGPDAEVFSAGDALTIDGGTFELVASDDCFSAKNRIKVNGGLVHAVSTENDVFDSNGDMEINGGTILAYATAEGHEAFDVDPEQTEEGSYPHQLRLNGGTIFATGGRTADWPDDLVLGDRVQTFAAEDLDAAVYSGRYLTLTGTTGVKTTAKLPVFPSTRCAVLATCPFLTGTPSVASAAPSSGSQDFHELYVSSTIATNQDQLRFLEIYGSTADGASGDTGEYIVLTNVSDKVVQLAGLKVNVEKLADWDKSGESASKCLFTLTGGEVPAYGSVRLEQANYWNGAKQKISNGELHIELVDSTGQTVQYGKASFDETRYPGVDGGGASLVAVSFEVQMKDDVAYWRSSGAAQEPDPIEPEPDDPDPGVDADCVQLWKDGPYWAKTNLGAASEEASGEFYLWGNTIGYAKDGATWTGTDGSTSGNPFGSNVHKGKSVDQLTAAGVLDASGFLTPSYDAAHAVLGGFWRLPTKADCEAIATYCTTSAKTINGVKGVEIRGTGDYADAAIFIPCSGYAEASSGAVNNKNGQTYYLTAGTPGNGTQYSCLRVDVSGSVARSSAGINNGYQIRAVRDYVAPETVDWDHPVKTLAAGVKASEAWPTLAGSKLANAKASRLQSWAKNVGKVSFTDATKIREEAFLLNCADNDTAINAAKAAFKFDAVQPGTLPQASDFAAKDYNGTVRILGCTDLVTDTWGEAEAGDKFFRAELTLE